MKNDQKAYLGDSVYAEIQNGTLTLTTENGLGPSNTIHLEPSVIENLANFLRRKGGGPLLADPGADIA